MRMLIGLATAVTGFMLATLPSAAAEKCGFTLTGDWGFLDAKTNAFQDQGSASAKSCNGIQMTLSGLKGDNIRPEAIMTAQGAASFATNLNFIARGFVPTDDRTSMAAGRIPWQLVPPLDSVTASETQLALRASDGLADTVFFRVSTGDLCFLIVRSVTGASYDELLANGDLLNPNL